MVSKIWELTSSANRTNYRSLLRSSSIWESRDPPPRILFQLISMIKWVHIKMWYASIHHLERTNKTALHQNMQYYREICGWLGNQSHTHTHFYSIRHSCQNNMSRKPHTQFLSLQISSYMGRVGLRMIQPVPITSLITHQCCNIWDGRVQDLLKPSSK